MARVFISHSSKDVQLAELLVDLLRSALNLPGEVILCTSVEGHRLPGGADVDQALRDEIRDSEAFIGLISKASIESVHVLFELGARWGQEKPLLPLLAPNADASVLRGPLTRINAFKCSDASDLHKMVDQVGELLDVRPQSAAVYQKCIEKIQSLAGGLRTAAISSTAPGEEGRLIFSDWFDEFRHWHQYRKGHVSQSSEITPHAGTFCLKKDTEADPHGGFRELGKQTGPGLAFSGWIYSPGGRGPAPADRLALEDSDFNGYGFCVDHGGNAVCIERRDKGIGSPIGQTVSFTAPSSQWYRFEFQIKTGGRLKLMLCGRSGEDPLTNLVGRDEKYSSYDRVVVHGGHDYYVDDLRIVAL